MNGGPAALEIPARRRARLARLAHTARRWLARLAHRAREQQRKDEAETRFMALIFDKGVISGARKFGLKLRVRRESVLGAAAPLAVAVARPVARRGPGKHRRRRAWSLRLHDPPARRAAHPRVPRRRLCRLGSAARCSSSKSRARTRAERRRARTTAGRAHGLRGRVHEPVRVRADREHGGPRGLRPRQEDRQRAARGCAPQRHRPARPRQRGRARRRARGRADAVARRGHALSGAQADGPRRSRGPRVA